VLAEDSPDLLISEPIFLSLLTSEAAGAGDIVRLEAERLEAVPGSAEPAVRRLERLARPDRRLTVAQARATGLSNKQLDTAAELDEVLQDLVEYSEGAGAWIVAEGAATREALRTAAAAAGLPRSIGPAIVGVDELGVIVCPTVCRRGVADLLAHYRRAGRIPPATLPLASSASAGEAGVSPGASGPATKQGAQSGSRQAEAGLACTAGGTPALQTDPAGVAPGSTAGKAGSESQALTPTAGQQQRTAFASAAGPSSAEPSQETTPSADAFPPPALLREIWTCLEEDLLRLPLPLLAEMNWLLAKAEHPLKAVLKSVEKHAVETQFADSFRSGKLSVLNLFKDFSDTLRLLAPKEEEQIEDAEPRPPKEPVTAEEVARWLGPSGPLSRGLPGYEERREQVEMAGRVGEALSAGRHLIAEAGTGVGKSLAYLVPGLLFAQRAGRPLIISTHTKNLQSQLFFKDLPLVRRALEVDVRAALLKGRPNYLCVRKLAYTLQESAHELDDEDVAALLPVLTWAVQTQTGDVAEMAAFAPEVRPELWDRLHTVGEDCLSRQCPHFNKCFVYRARALARAADVVVANHALVFAELGLEGTFPPYHEIVFDEAHTLEDVATEHLACEVTPRRVSRILHRLFRAPPGSTAGKGLLPSLLFQLEQNRHEFPEPLFVLIREHILEAIQVLGPADTATGGFFDTWREWFERGGEPADEETPLPDYVPRERGRGRRGEAPSAARGPRARRSQRDDNRRFSAATLPPDEATTLGGAKTSLVAALGRARQVLEHVEEDFKEIRKRDVPRAREMQREIAAQNLFLQELISDLEFVVKGDEPNYVYWAEKFGRRAMRVVAAPLDLSGLLHEQLYERKRSIIFTSATLSVRDAGADAGSGLAALPATPRLPPPPRDESYQESPDDLTPPEIARPVENLTPHRPHAKAFEFIKQRLGLTLCAAGKVEDLLEGSPFDYPRQCRLYVPTCLPEPGSREKDFHGALSALVAPLVIASRGRTMVLYTSYEALSSGAAALRKSLAAERIEVLAQGEDGSREVLLAKLREGGRRVLLGTASFWEGVDVPGEALSLLVIAKLPFAVFTDPLVAGRCELLEAQGKDPFLHFSVPNAILKLRQGFGRLIRSKTDRGVVILCDKRVLTKRYGPAFLRALPVPARKAHDVDRLAEEVKGFLDGGAGAS
jgi:ATP-dependent DNA helicase DinG